MSRNRGAEFRGRTSTWRSGAGSPAARIRCLVRDSIGDSARQSAYGTPIPDLTHTPSAARAFDGPQQLICRDVRSHCSVEDRKNVHRRDAARQVDGGVRCCCDEDSAAIDGQGPWQFLVNDKAGPRPDAPGIGRRDVESAITSDVEALEERRSGMTRNDWKAGRVLEGCKKFPDVVRGASWKIDPAPGPNQLPGIHRFASRAPAGIQRPRQNDDASPISGGPEIPADSVVLNAVGCIVILSKSVHVVIVSGGDARHDGRL